MGPAWADKASALNTAHEEAECSNAGVCNRATGVCDCFAGFTGASCQRRKEDVYVCGERAETAADNCLCCVDQFAVRTIAAGTETV